jgi:hypothetical protein
MELEVGKINDPEETYEDFVKYNNLVETINKQ